MILQQRNLRMNASVVNAAVALFHAIILTLCRTKASSTTITTIRGRYQLLHHHHHVLMKHQKSNLITFVRRNCFFIRNHYNVPFTKQHERHNTGKRYSIMRNPKCNIRYLASSSLSLCNILSSRIIHFQKRSVTPLSLSYVNHDEPTQKDRIATVHDANDTTSSLLRDNMTWKTDENINMINNDKATHNEIYHKIILSDDPYMYMVPNLLSEKECQMFIEYSKRYKNMTKSNPPAVSIDYYKLWPLPFLSVLGGVPTYMKLINGDDNRIISPLDIVSHILPSIGFTFVSILLFTFFIMMPLIRHYTDQNSRTSVAAALNQVHDMEMIHPLLQRIYSVTKHPIYHYEAPVISYYP